jgi:uncharacterized membrane protein SirB2
MSYAAVKHVHVGAAAASLALFSLRGAWMRWSPARLDRAWVRIVPHVVDTVLLASALWLAVTLGAFPGWLAAKVIALLCYIALGTIALKRGRTRAQRTTALVAALATFAYIVSVAVTKSPLGLLARL